MKKTLLALREDKTDHNIKSEKMSSSEHGMELFARLDSITIKKEVISVIVSLHLNQMNSNVICANLNSIMHFYIYKCVTVLLEYTLLYIVKGSNAIFEACDDDDPSKCSPCHVQLTVNS